MHHGVNKTVYTVKLMTHITVNYETFFVESNQQASRKKRAHDTFCTLIISENAYDRYCLTRDAYNLTVEMFILSLDVEKPSM